MMEYIVAGDLKKASEYLIQYDAEDFETYMESWGDKVEVLGDGAYSFVIMKRGEPTAIKITYDYDPSWIEYARYAMDNHKFNSLLPVIHELHPNDDGELCIARLELLGRAAITRTVGMRDVVSGIHYKVMDENTSNRGLRNHALELLRKKFDFGYNGVYDRNELANLVVWLTKMIFRRREAGYDTEIDVHGGNWMMRGHQLVLTDPVS